MPGSVDLTPFGFTPTESQVYGALLRLGPSTGYAVAHATRVARANTYGALEGLSGRPGPGGVAPRSTPGSSSAWGETPPPRPVPSSPAACRRTRPRSC